MTTTDPLFLFFGVDCLALATRTGVWIGIDITWCHAAIYEQASREILQLLETRTDAASKQPIAES